MRPNKKDENIENVQTYIQTSKHIYLQGVKHVIHTRHLRATGYFLNDFIDLLYKR